MLAALTVLAWCCEGLTLLLIGLIANGVEERVNAMRRGRSTVIESGHVVILGASSRLPIVIEQLALANRTRRSNAIAAFSRHEPLQLQ